MGVSVSAIQVWGIAWNSLNRSPWLRSPMIVLRPAKMAHKSTPKIAISSHRLGSLRCPAEQRPAVRGRKLSAILRVLSPQ